jgi:hypothetical protein
MHFSAVAATVLFSLFLDRTFAEPVRRNLDAVRDPQFDCPALDHYFQHQRNWIAASSTTGCMSLEKDLDTIHTLNALASPTPDGFRKGNTLCCSLEKKRCDWHYSPLDPVGVGDLV